MPGGTESGESSVQVKRRVPSKKRITARSIPNKRRERGTDWNRVAALGDDTIRKSAASDPDAAPIADAAWFRRANIVLPEPKKAVSLRLDRDVMAWFQRQGKGCQTRINAVLRAYVQAQQSPSA
jgi:uncharacterized protein (DUF4415 family)